MTPRHDPIERSDDTIARSRLAAIVTSSADAIIGETLDGIITDWNPAAERLYGYTAEEAIGQHLSILAPVDLVDEPAQLLARVCAGESIEGIETVRRTKDGRRIAVSLTVSPVWNEAGQIVAASGISRDISERTAAEAERAATHQHTRQVLERITDGFYALDRAWRFTYLNDAAERITGRTRDELLGRNVWEEFAPAIETPLFPAFHRSMAEGIPVTLDYYYAPRDRWMEVRAYPSPDGLSVFFHDVSERVRAEAALRRSEARFRSLISNATDIITILAADGIVLYESPPIERILGYDHDELVGTNVFDLIHPEDRAATWAAFAEVLADPTLTPTVEFRFQHKDGSWRWLEATSTNLLTDADVEGFVVNSRDITERKQTEEALQAAKEAWRRSFDALPDHLCILDRSGTILQANKTMRERFEPIHGSLIGLDYRLVYCGSTTPFPPPPCASVLTGGPAVAVETALPTMEGHYLVASFPIDVNGERQGAVSVVRDITERTILEQELRTALEAAQAGNRAQSQFLTMMSHELRTPMQAVLGYADLLLVSGEGPLTPDQFDDVRAIRRGAERMVVLVTQMLDLSRLEAGRMELASGPVDLGKIIAQVRQDVAPQATAKGLTLHTDLPSDLPPVRGDTGGIHQMLLNLAGNAVKFTAAGSVRITASVTEEEVTVAVRDTGIGIAAEALPQIFEEFRQVDNGMTRRHDGAGLGLAIAKMLAEQMGARICVESCPGAGSTFTLHLPLWRETAPARDEDV